MSSTSLDPLLFRRACAQFATGIAIATTMGTDGRPHGLTINSFTSVSLTPPLVLICIDNRAAVLRAFASSPSFAINILHASQQHLSFRFSQPVEDRFDTLAWRPGSTLSPLLDGVLAQLECRTAQRIEAGDHTIYLGEVVHVALQSGEPLLYFNSRYAHLWPAAPAEV